MRIDSIEAKGLPPGIASEYGNMSPIAGGGSLEFCKFALLILLSAGVTACAGSTAPEDLPRLQIGSASLHQRADGATLDVALDWHASSLMLDALDHGIPLDLRLRIDAQSATTFGWRNNVASNERHVQLRYFPLSRQYVLRDLEHQDERHFIARASLFAALEDLHLPLIDWNDTRAERYRVLADLDSAVLPGAMRVSVWFDPAWRMPATEFTWPVTAHE
ncbi:DUF4390 domain-containing protein [Pseudolysobacter antarcticus]|uniref:DUF4390 domain-containing protein n=1 Tax=Pseudolysobacter antarcticus TaxID=2511995 RepID=A0A411HPN8_9GAMM|nr:DUF4390 domain-containing protein [Pseudolysobacter antarcticus]QBB72469.1 DUF4390 domain-containing protein [Pseudolysobacter antarcticus]